MLTKIIATNAAYLLNLKNAQEKIASIQNIFKNLVFGLEGKRILLLGTGLVGTNILEAATSLNLPITATYNSHKIKNAVYLPVLQENKILGINIQGIKKILTGTKPDLIINTIALAKPSDCQKNEKLAWLLNSTFPNVLANMIGALSPATKLIQLSTECVFDGYKISDSLSETLSENDPQDSNTYSLSKKSGEELIYGSNISTLITRLSNTLGFTEYQTTWEDQVKETLMADRPLNVFQNEARYFASALETGYRLLQLGYLFMKKEIPYKIIHLPGPELVTRKQLAQDVANLYGFNPGLINEVPVPGNLIRRPYYLLARQNIANLGAELVLTTEETVALIRYQKEILQPT
ncbi:MAG: sugar nucleotide-binding protein [Candidatus Margulisbacteria bacterium]|nr:sugar nucleotide-binding protein [Candidatus Margulisiibacteriota bacterium]